MNLCVEAAGGVSGAPSTSTRLPGVSRRQDAAPGRRAPSRSRSRPRDSCQALSACSSCRSWSGCSYFQSCSGESPHQQQIMNTAKKLNANRHSPCVLAHKRCASVSGRLSARRSSTARRPAVRQSQKARVAPRAPARCARGLPQLEHECGNASDAIWANSTYPRSADAASCPSRRPAGQRRLEMIGNGGTLRRGPARTASSVFST